jgi:hypothetical protein
MNSNAKTIILVVVVMVAIVLAYKFIGVPGQPHSVNVLMFVPGYLVVL